MMVWAEISLFIMVFFYDFPYFLRFSLIFMNIQMR